MPTNAENATGASQSGQIQKIQRNTNTHDQSNTYKTNKYINTNTPTNTNTKTKYKDKYNANYKDNDKYKYKCKIQTQRQVAKPISQHKDKQQQNTMT